MYGPVSPVEAKVLQFARDHRNIQQLGQGHDDHVHNGHTACTHAVWQFIAELCTGEMRTLNEINKKAGMKENATGVDGPRGMRPNEVQALIDNLDLPYKIVTGASFKFLRRQLVNGPVMYAIPYGSAPEKRGFTYNGVMAKAPFARRGGATQLGPDSQKTRHAVVMLAQRQLLRANPTGTVTRPKGANVRAKPELMSTLVRNLPKGTTVSIAETVIGDTWVVRGHPGRTWYRITAIDGTPVSPPVFSASGQFDAEGAAEGLVIYRKDPNHGSSARPERPPYDIIMRQQARREYRDYMDKLHMNLYAAIPKRKLDL